MICRVLVSAERVDRRLYEQRRMNDLKIREDLDSTRIKKLPRFLCPYTFYVLPQTQKLETSFVFIFLRHHQMINCY